MSDIPANQSETKEVGETQTPPERVTDQGKSLIEQGIPLDDESRMDLYELKNKKADREELGEYFKNLPPDKQKELQDNAVVDGDGTSIIDKKGGEILDFPEKE